MSEGDWEIVRLVASLAKTMADSLKAEVDFWKDKHMQSQERILMLQSDLTKSEQRCDELFDESAEFEQGCEELSDRVEKQQTIIAEQAAFIAHFREECKKLAGMHENGNIVVALRTLANAQIASVD